MIKDYIVAGRRLEVGAIKNVEKLGSELDIEGFRDPPDGVLYSPWFRPLLLALGITAPDVSVTVPESIAPDTWP